MNEEGEWRPESEKATMKIEQGVLWRIRVSTLMPPAAFLPAGSRCPRPLGADGVRIKGLHVTPRYFCIW